MPLMFGFFIDEIFKSILIFFLLKILKNEKY
jgi:hypothetical protein